MEVLDYRKLRKEFYEKQKQERKREALERVAKAYKESQLKRMKVA